MLKEEVLTWTLQVKGSDRLPGTTFKNGPRPCVLGTHADAQTASVQGVSGTLPISWVRGPSAGDRHPLLLVLTLF